MSHVCLRVLRCARMDGCLHVVTVARRRSFPRSERASGPGAVRVRAARLTAMVSGNVMPVGQSVGPPGGYLQRSVDA